MSLHAFYTPCNQGGAGSAHSMHQQLPVMIGSQRALLHSPMCKALQASKLRFAWLDTLGIAVLKASFANTQTLLQVMTIELLNASNPSGQAVLLHLNPSNMGVHFSRNSGGSLASKRCCILSRLYRELK